MIDLDILYRLRYSLSSIITLTPTARTTPPTIRVPSACSPFLQPGPRRLIRRGCGIRAVALVAETWAELINNNRKNNYIAMSESLCVKCQKFFGNPKSLNMCSVCYK